MKDEEWYWNERLNNDLLTNNNYISYKQSQEQRPHIIYNPQLYLDGNEWCALLGTNIQEGVSGFGKTPEQAMEDFDENWQKAIK